MTTDSKRRDPVATRNAILESARDLFVDQGFAATSMSDIAKQAGVTKSLIHHHFGSKQDLWAELKRTLLAHYADLQMRLLAESDDGKDLLQQSLEVMFRFFRDNPAFVRLSGWMDLEKDRSLAQAAYPEMVRTGVERVRSEQEAGLLRSDIEAAHMISAMVSLCAHWFRARPEMSSIYDGDIEDWDESYLSAIRKILANGVLAGSRSEPSGGLQPVDQAKERGLSLEVLKGEFAVCRSDGLSGGSQAELEQLVAVSSAGSRATLWSLCVTANEVSLVCDSALAPAHMNQEAGWRALKVDGVLDFSLVGILSSLTAVLAEAQVSVFAISTFDTDYILVQGDSLEVAVSALRAADVEVRETQ